MNRGKTSRIENASEDYGLGLDAVVVVVSFFSVVAGGFTTVVSFFSVAGGFTTVVLCSVFFSAGAGEVGATTSVFCSQAPRSAALAKMQIIFFIVWIGCPSWDIG
jgi:hypothetical protein